MKANYQLLRLHKLNLRVFQMGLSVWGPGCSLPARFIDFEHFVPWIMSNMETRRTFWKPESIGIRPDRYRDKWMLWRLNDQSLALRPRKCTEEILGNFCILITVYGFSWG